MHTARDTNDLIRKSTEKSFPAESFFPVRINGKPYIFPQRAYVGVTNSRGVALIALSRKKFGIDMECKRRTVKNRAAIAARFFSPRERRYATAPERFLEIWVKKEAYAKFTGRGLSSFKSFDVFCVGGSFTLHRHPQFLIYSYTP